jgi:hypothetical protein
VNCHICCLYTFFSFSNIEVQFLHCLPAKVLPGLVLYSSLVYKHIFLLQKPCPYLTLTILLFPNLSCMQAWLTKDHCGAWCGHNEGGSCWVLVEMKGTEQLCSQVAPPSPYAGDQAGGGTAWNSLESASHSQWSSTYKI